MRECVLYNAVVICYSTSGKAAAEDRKTLPWSCSRGIIIIIIIIMKMYIVQKYTEKMKNKNTHGMIELGLIGTHQLYHKINVFTVKTL